MRTRKLGKTTVDVGEIGLGTWGLSGEAYGPIDPGQARATLETAIEAGASFVDTAGCYGPDGAVERMIGEVLRGRGRDRAFVSTRVGVDRDGAHGLPRKRFDRRSIVALTEASLGRLGTDHLDALVLHNPMPTTLRTGEAIPALLELRAQGKARFVGVSVGSVDAARAALEHPIDLLELPYNLLYPRLLHALAGEISAAGVGVVVRSPLAYGVLAGTWAASRRFADGDHRAERWSPAELARRIRQREAARAALRDKTRGLREAALGFVLYNKLVSVAVVGARTPGHVRENAAVADAPPLSELEFDAVTARLQDEGVEF